MMGQRKYIRTLVISRRDLKIFKSNGDYGIDVTYFMLMHLLDVTVRIQMAKPPFFSLTLSLEGLLDGLLLFLFFPLSARLLECQENVKKNVFKVGLCENIEIDSRVMETYNQRQTSCSPYRTFTIN